MEDSLFKKQRRMFLAMILAYGTFGITCIPDFIRLACAMGSRDYPEGIRKLRGKVNVNGEPAQLGTMIKAGDIVSTGPESFVVFVAGKDVYLVRDNSQIEISDESSEELKEQVIDVLRIFKGKVLSVLGRGRKRFITSTAVVGIRGTGIYIEAEPERSYICTCYGIADIAVKTRPEIRETVKTGHHESPRYVYALRTGNLIEKAPVINHTDKELIMLEKMVGRKPPFISWYPGSGKGEGGGSGY